MNVRTALLVVVSAGFVAGCWPAPGASVAYTAAVLYARGARQNTVSAKLKIPPRTVFAGMIRAAHNVPDLDVVNRQDEALLIELGDDEIRLAAQATDIGNGHTLLFVWADAGTTGQTGRDLAIETVQAICEELGVEYEIVEL